MTTPALLIEQTVTANVDVTTHVNVNVTTGTTASIHPASALNHMNKMTSCSPPNVAPTMSQPQLSSCNKTVMTMMTEPTTTPQQIQPTAVQPMAYETYTYEQL